MADLHLEVDLAKWAAPLVAKPIKTQPLRFKLSDRVGIRVQDNADGYENWLCGNVVEVWPTLPGNHETQGFLASANSVPYKVLTDDKIAFYCHRDDHTLIRKAENVPQTQVKTISSRFERRQLLDGTFIKFDHVTMRSRKIMEEFDEEGSNHDITISETKRARLE